MRYNNLIVDLLETERGLIQNWHYDLFDNISPEIQAKKISYDINLYNNDVNFESLNININYYICRYLNNFKYQVAKENIYIKSDKFHYVVKLSFTV